ncbi:MAG: hypothetical protein RMJ56_06500 [Gemmataceae bacterium]|nr:hypothetical protein [Gemmata sp.]MDW8197240.1 hypothetical protein [Gemmataceae bacterium]
MRMATLSGTAMAVIALSVGTASAQPGPVVVVPTGGFSQYNFYRVSPIVPLTPVVPIAPVCPPVLQPAWGWNYNTFGLTVVRPTWSFSIGSGTVSPLVTPFYNYGYNYGWVTPHPFHLGRRW